MARAEFYYDPEAPTATSIVVAVTAFVLNEGGDVLLVRRSDNGLWALPGGGQEIGEYVAEAAARETRKEAGIEVEVTGLVGIYSDPNHVLAFDDGEVRQQFSICFRARPLGGDLSTSDETTDVRWVSPADLDTLPMSPSMRLRIDHGYEPRPEPYLG